MNQPLGKVWVMAKGYAPDEGGMQTYAAGVAHAWAAAGNAVTVFTQTSAGPRIAEDGPVRIVDVGPGKSIRVPMALLRAMREETKRAGKPNFVHATTWRTAILPALRGLPFAVTFHGREFAYPSGLALRVMRWVAARARAVIAVSHYSASRLAARLAGAPKITVAWNGPSPLCAGQASPSPWPQDAGAKLLSLCRLEPRKNLSAVLRACARARDQGHRFHLVIGGRGPDEARLKHLARELSLEDHVTFTGFVPSDAVASLYREAEIFLHPQIEEDGGRDFEGFGIAIADAMLAACAVVVGAQGGSRELVDEGSGIVVDGGDQDAVDRALDRLLREPDLRRELALSGQRRAAELFTWERHVALVREALTTA